MPFYRDHIYPRLVAALGDPPPIQKVRQKIVLSLVVSRLVLDTGHSISDRAGRFSDRADGAGILGPISEVVVILLVGRCHFTER